MTARADGGKHRGTEARRNTGERGKPGADGGNTEAQRHREIPEMGESKGRWKDWVMERLGDAKKAVSPKA